MGLISQSKWRETIPHEPESWIEFKLLNLAALEEARQVRQQRSMALVQGLDMTQFQGLEAPAQRDVKDDYDLDTLLRRSVVAWSYGEVVDVDDLDNLTAQWAIGVIIARNGLDETQEARKNGSKRPTDHSKG